MKESEKIERIKSALMKFSEKSSKVQGAKIVGRIAKVTGLNEVDTRQILKALDGNEISCKNWGFNNEPLGTVTINIKAEIPTELIRWKTALEKHTRLELEEIESLTGLWTAVSEISDSEQLRLIDGLVNLKAEQEQWFGETKFNVSARYLLGSSKVLDNLPKQNLIKFGIQVDQFKSPPSYLIMTGPANPKAVILVENPQSFERAVEAGIPDITWITTFGYGLSKMNEDHGNQLSNIFNSRMDNGIILLAREGSPVAISSLLSNPNIHFWGDFDPEGFKIYESLKKIIPQLELSALYQPMLDKLEREGHSFTSLVGKQGQVATTNFNNLISELLSGDETTVDVGLDQESVTLRDIFDFAGRPLTEVVKYSMS